MAPVSTDIQRLEEQAGIQKSNLDVPDELHEVLFDLFCVTMSSCDRLALSDSSGGRCNFWNKNKLFIIDQKTHLKYFITGYVTTNLVFSSSPVYIV